MRSPSVQTLELQQADNLDDLCAELLQQVDSRLKRAAGSDEVVHNDDLHTRLDVIAVYHSMVSMPYSSS